MGYRIIKFELEGNISYGIVATMQYIIFTWADWAVLSNKDKIKQKRFSSKEIKEELTTAGCDPDSFFAVPTE